MKTLFFFFLSSLLAFAENKQEDPFSREQWESYFAQPTPKEVKWGASFGLAKFQIIERHKGQEEGWEKVVTLYAGGPIDGSQETSFHKADEKGLWTKNESGEVKLLTPFPLKLNQTWKSGDAEVKLIALGIERETVERTLKNCLLMEHKTKDGTVYKKWYAPKIGLVAVMGGGMTKVRK